MTPHAAGEGDAFPPQCEVIEVRVGSIGQLFKAIDPSPFRTRDLRTDVEEFIIDWARQTDRHVPLALRVHIDRPPGAGDTVDELREAVQAFFQNRAEGTRRRLQVLLGVGRTSLLIGLVCLAVAAGLSDLVGR